MVQTTKGAKTLYNSKILALRSNLATLQESIERKDSNANAVVEVLKLRMAQQDRNNRLQAAEGRP
jgi:prefoldin alpha subunit